MLRSVECGIESFNFFFNYKKVILEDRYFCSMELSKCLKPKKKMGLCLVFNNKEYVYK
jgi:UTP-glucose-1-phosphate uridylyltransferase